MKLLCDGFDGCGVEIGLLESVSASDGNMEFRPFLQVGRLLDFCFAFPNNVRYREEQRNGQGKGEGKGLDFDSFPAFTSFSVYMVSSNLRQ